MASGGSRAEPRCWPHSPGSAPVLVRARRCLPAGPQAARGLAAAAAVASHFRSLAVASWRHDCCCVLWAQHGPERILWLDTGPPMLKVSEAFPGNNGDSRPGGQRPLGSVGISSDPRVREGTSPLAHLSQFFQGGE